MRENDLIKTKFRFPQVQSGLVRRDELINRLIEGNEKRLTVITGLAGAGKTCLALQWIEASTLKAFWYTIDETDNDSDLFFRYFLSAIGRINRESESIVRPILNNQKRISRQKILPLLEKCGQCLDDDVYLILDDFHNIVDESVHDALSGFLRYMPQKMHLGIISRHDLPFSVSDLMMKNLMTEISADDLKFSWQEAWQYFKNEFSVDFSVDQIVELNSYLEGWIGGLQLFGIFLNREKVWDSLYDMKLKSCREVTGFLIDQVINTQSEAVRAFIQSTAVLNRFNVELCQAVTGMNDAAELLRLVCRNNLFVIPLNMERTWFRYHTVLSEALKTHLKQNNFEAFQSIHRKAATWFVDNNNLEEAFRHAFLSEDPEFIGDLLEDHLMALFDQYEVAAFRRWLAKFPHQSFLERSLLRLYECRYKIESLDLLEAKSTLDYFENQENPFERYQGAKRDLCQDYLVLLRCRLNYWMDPLGLDVARHREQLQRIAARNRVFSNFIEVEIAASYFLKGEMNRSKEMLNSLSADILASKSPLLNIVWYRLIIAVERKMGHLDRATKLLNDVNRQIDQMGLSDSPIKSMLYLEIAWIQYYRADLGQGSEYAAMAITNLNEATGYLHEIVEANYLAALIYIVKNEPEAVEQCLEKIKQTGKLSDNHYVVSMAEALSARISIALGDLDWPGSWVERRKLRLDEPFSFRYVHECLAQVELYIELKKYEKAIQMIDSVRERCKSNQLEEPILNIDLLRAISLLGLSKSNEAEAVFEAVFNYAANEGYIMPFVRYTDKLLPLLNRQAGKIQWQEIRNRSQVNILKACGIRGKMAPLERPESRIENELTQRELEILKLLAEGFKYKEIAEKSYISIDTVRTHIKHVYTKLGVKSSVSAIKKAETLGILTDIS